MGTEDLSQQSDVTNDCSPTDGLTSHQKMVTAAKKVLVIFACVIGCIVVFGAVDLYGEMVWSHIKGIVTLNSTSVWPSCVIGLLSTAVGSWAIISLTQSVKSTALIVITLLSVCFWMIGFSAANALVFDDEFPELGGFVWWAYLALWIPIFAAVVSCSELHFSSAYD